MAVALVLFAVSSSLFLFLSRHPLQHCIGSKLYDSEKYQMTEHLLNPYTWSMNLTIRNLQMGDFRAYLCTSDNGLGSDEARVRLQGECGKWRIVLSIDFISFFCLLLSLAIAQSYACHRPPQPPRSRTSRAHKSHVGNSSRRTTKTTFPR